jgi:O-antigen ligase
MRFLENVFTVWEKIKDTLFLLFLIIMVFVFIASSVSFFLEGDLLYAFILFFLFLMTSLFIKPAFSDVFSKQKDG